MHRIGRLVKENPKRAAYEMRELMRAANGNDSLVVEQLGVTYRQWVRWVKRLLDEGIADLRTYRRKVRARVPGAVHADAAGRTQATEP